MYILRKFQYLNLRLELLLNHLARMMRKWKGLIKWLYIKNKKNEKIS